MIRIGRFGRRILFLLFCSIVSANASDSFTGANLLTNPGFEEGDAQPADWWNGFWGRGGVWKWTDNGQARNSRSAVAIGFEPESIGGTGYWGQTVSRVEAGERFDFSVWTKTEPHYQGRVWLIVEFKDREGNFLATNSSAVLSGEHTGYKRISLQTDPAPAGTVEATFQIRAGGSRNSAIFDDAHVRYIDHPDALLGAPLTQQEMAEWKDRTNQTCPHRWKTKRWPNGGWTIESSDGKPFLPSGIDYEPLSLYHPLDWERVERDLDLIRDAGFNTVTIWCVDFHGRLGGYRRLSLCDMARFAELTRARGLFIQFYLCLDRLVHLFPRATLADGRQHHFDIDYADPDYRAFCRNYAQRMAMTLHDHDNVSTIIPWEEKVGLDANFDGNQTKVFALYASKAGKAGFADWLQHRHKTIVQLNTRWRTEYASFQDAVERSLAEYHKGVSRDDARQFDILEYGQVFLMDFTRNFVEAYKELDPTMLFQCRHYDLFGPVRPLHPELNFLDTFGINNYTLGAIGPDFCFREEFIKTKLVAGIAGIAPYVGNYGFRAGAQDQGTHGLVESEAMKAHFGADSLMAYSFIPELAGLSYYMYLYAGWEGPWGIVRGEARERTPIYDAFKAANTLLTLKNETIARADYAEKARIHVFHGLDAIFDLDPKGWIEHPNLSFDLTEMNINYDVITDTDSFDPAQRPIIFALCHAYDRKLDGSIARKLVQYTQNGGVLVAANTFGLQDRYLRADPAMAQLARQMRGVEIGARRQGSIVVRGKDLPPVTFDDAWYVEARSETLAPEAEVLLTMTVGDTERPALIRIPYGKGTFYYFLFNPLRNTIWTAGLDPEDRPSLPVIEFLCRQMGLPVDSRLGNRGFELGNGRVNIHEKLLHAPLHCASREAGRYDDEYGETDQTYSGGVFTDDVLSFRGRRCEERGWTLETPEVTSIGAGVDDAGLIIFTLDAVELSLRKGPWDIRLQTDPFRVYHLPLPESTNTTAAPGS